MRKIDSYNQSEIFESSLETLQDVRVARISTVPFFILSQLKHQLVSLAASGAKITVVTSEAPELAALKSLTNMICVPIEIPRSISPWRDLCALLQLFRFFKSESIQIVHSTTPKAGLLSAIAAFFAGVPIRLHTFTGQPWVSMTGVKHWLAKGSDWLIGKLNTRCYADSNSQRNFLIENKIIRSVDISVIGMGSLAGVDIERFDPIRFSINDRNLVKQELAISDDYPIVLFIGRITVDKGVRELLAAFVNLTGDGVKAHLVFVGRFDDESGVSGSMSRQDIEKVNNTHIVEYTDKPEKYFSIADFLCLPSYREGFGTVVIEAAAMGIPTIGTDIYGLSDAVVDGKTGLLVPLADLNALTNALTLLIKDKVLRQKMGAAASSRAKQFFDARIVTQELINEYCRLLSNHRKKSPSPN